MTARPVFDNATCGAAMVLLATVGWSFSGLFTRAMTLDLPTTVALRALAGGAFLFLPMLFRFRADAFRRLVDIGAIGWIAVTLSSVALAATTASLMMTSVAHVIVIYATCPFIAAIIARVWLGEMIRLSTLVAILLSMMGIVVVISGSTGASTLLGDAMALLMTIAFSAIIVMSKAHAGLKIVEVTILSAFLTFGLFVPFSSGANLGVLNIALVSTYGLVNLVLAFLLFIKGARHIPAATSGLIVTLEIVLSPLWVWLAFGEVVDSATLLGAVIVAVAVVGHLLLSFISSRRSREALSMSPRSEVTV